MPRNFRPRVGSFSSKSSLGFPSTLLFTKSRYFHLTPRAAMKLPAGKFYPSTSLSPRFDQKLSSAAWLAAARSPKTIRYFEHCSFPIVATTALFRAVGYVRLTNPTLEGGFLRYWVDEANPANDAKAWMFTGVGVPTVVEQNAIESFKPTPSEWLNSRGKST